MLATSWKYSTQHDTTMYLVRSENPALELYTIVKTVFKTHEYRKLYYLNKITHTVSKKESICWSHYY